MDLLQPFDLQKTAFTPSSEARPLIQKRAQNHPDAECHTLGLSDEGRQLYAVELGRGPIRVSLLAGAHSDEPVGPETLRTFLMQGLANRDNPRFESLLDQFTFSIIPHINPDGESVNWSWIRQWPDLEAYIEHAFREAPGRDLEFGYPAMRPENRLVSSFLRDNGPFDLHMSLHGMAFSEGLMLLIERHWIDRTESLRTSFRHIADSHDLPLHDHDREGEKGFKYIGPGFNSTPEGRAMQKHFKNQGDEETASKFHLSSMEFVRSLGGDPLCLVTELPLFMVKKKNANTETQSTGHPDAYLSLKEKIPLLRQRRSREKPFRDLLEPFRFTTLDLATALTIQFQTLESALQLTKETANS